MSWQPSGQLSPGAVGTIGGWEFSDKLSDATIAYLVVGPSHKLAYDEFMGALQEKANSGRVRSIRASRCL